MQLRLHDYLSVCNDHHQEGEARAVQRPSSRVKVTASPKQCSNERSVSTSSIGPIATTSPSRNSNAWDVVAGSSSKRWLTCTVVGASEERGRVPSADEDEGLAPGKVHSRTRLVQEQQGMFDEQRSGEQDALALAL